MDVHEQLETQGVVSVGVLGRGEEFVLIRVGAEYEGKHPAAAPVERTAEEEPARPGVLEGFLLTAALETDPETLGPMRLAVFAFAEMVGAPAPTKAAPEVVVYGDTAEWLEGLFALPDERD